MRQPQPLPLPLPLPLRLFLRLFQVFGERAVSLGVRRPAAAADSLHLPISPATLRPQAAVTIALAPKLKVSARTLGGGLG